MPDLSRDGMDNALARLADSLPLFIAALILAVIGLTIWVKSRDQYPLVATATAWTTITLCFALVIIGGFNSLLQLPSI